MVRVTEPEGRREGEREKEKALGKDGGRVLWLFCHMCNLCLMLPGSPSDFLLWKRSTEYIRMICMILAIERDYKTD